MHQYCGFQGCRGLDANLAIGLQMTPCQALQGEVVRGPWIGTQVQAGAQIAQADRLGGGGCGERSLRGDLQCIDEQLGDLQGPRPREVRGRCRGVGRGPHLQCHTISLQCVDVQLRPHAALGQKPPIQACPRQLVDLSRGASLVLHTLGREVTQQRTGRLVDAEARNLAQPPPGTALRAQALQHAAQRHGCQHHEDEHRGEDPAAPSPSDAWQSLGQNLS